MNKQILRLAIPSIITNITVPLLGMVDTAIVGHLDTGGQSLDYIGGIAIGSMIFNFIYWNFGFLRIGTSGFTAQSYGAKDMQESMNTLIRAITIGLVSALLLITLQHPIAGLMKLIIEDKNNVWALAMQYFFIRIWAAPATLIMYGLKGWFIGMQDAKSPMWTSIAINVINIFFSLLFVIHFGMKIEGVALGTVISQYSGLVIMIIIWFRKYFHLKEYISLSQSLRLKKMRLFFKVNADIFLRTLFLVIVTTYFTIISSRFDYPILAVNTLIMQLFTIFSYFLDGFAYSAEGIVGKYYGAKNHRLLRASVNHILVWGVVISLIFSILYYFFGNSILGILTNKQEVLTAAQDYMYWAILIPITGFMAFLYDGILVGMTASALMRNVMFIAAFVFFALFYFLVPIWGNSALWFAFIMYLSSRSIFSWLWSRKLIYKKKL